MPVMRRIGRASRTRRANDSGSKTYALPELGDGRPLLDLVEHGTEERRATGGHVFIELPPPGCAAAARAVVEDGEGKIRASPLVQPRKAGVDRGHELFPRSSGRRLVGSHRGATAVNHVGRAAEPSPAKAELDCEDPTIRFGAFADEFGHPVASIKVLIVLRHEEPLQVDAIDAKFAHPPEMPEDGLRVRRAEYADGSPVGKRQPRWIKLIVIEFGEVGPVVHPDRRQVEVSHPCVPAPAIPVWLYRVAWGAEPALIAEDDLPIESGRIHDPKWVRWTRRPRGRRRNGPRRRHGAGGWRRRGLKNRCRYRRASGSGDGRGGSGKRTPFQATILKSFRWERGIGALAEP